MRTTIKFSADIDTDNESMFRDGLPISELLNSLKRMISAIEAQRARDRLEGQLVDINGMSIGDWSLEIY